jgi:hypothetical protein
LSVCLSDQPVTPYNCIHHDDGVLLILIGEIPTLCFAGDHKVV